MKELTYRFITMLSRKIGTWVFKTVAWVIASFYFILLPARTAISIKFYRALFAERGFFFALACSWRQYHNFTNVFFDRFILEDFDEISYTSEGWEHIEDAVKNKKGGLLLMSHIGNWEVAAHLLKRRGIKILLYMGIKQKERLEKVQKESLRKSGVSIVAVSQDGGSPFDILEGIKILKEGGLISMTGDMVWRKDQRIIKTALFGYEVCLPETPHLFALLSGSPLFFFFAFRTGNKKYHFKISPPMAVTASSRSERGKVLKKSVERYAAAMEDTVRKYPYQWYHFEPFLGEKTTD